jgi:hypothetical protein
MEGLCTCMPCMLPLPTNFKVKHWTFPHLRYCTTCLGGCELAEWGMAHICGKVTSLTNFNLLWLAFVLVTNGQHWWRRLSVVVTCMLFACMHGLSPARNPSRAKARKPVRPLCNRGPLVTSVSEGNDVMHVDCRRDLGTWSVMLARPTAVRDARPLQCRPVLCPVDLIA